MFVLDLNNAISKCQFLNCPPKYKAKCVRRCPLPEVGIVFAIVCQFIP